MKLENKVKAVKQEVSFGHLNINSSKFPFVKDMKIGEKTTLTIDVEIKGLRAPDRWEMQENGMKPTDINASVNITNIKAHKPSMKKED